MIMRIRSFVQQQCGALSVTEIDQRTADVTGVTLRTIQNIKQEAARCHPLPISSPCRLPRRTINSQIDNFDKGLIRKEILDFYERGELPTLDLVLEKVKKPPVNFVGGRTTFWKLIRQLGFRYGKAGKGRAILMERHDIVTSRNRYLRLLEKFRKSDNPRPEVYLDETWVNQRDSVGKCWSVGDGTQGPKTKSGKGARFIVLHAGGINGFVPDALLTFKSKNGTTGDYHDSMNYECFREWFEKKLLPQLEEGTIIIMDNATYHSKVINKTPTCSSNKNDIILWLSKNNIEHDATHSKAELLSICKRNKHKEKNEIDEIAFSHGHEVLRLPPYHCQLNPIELIWAQVKTYVKKRNSNANQTVKRVETLLKDAVESVSESDWKKCIDHTKKVEEEYRKMDVAREHLIEEMCVDIDTSDESSEV